MNSKENEQKIIEGKFYSSIMILIVGCFLSIALSVGAFLWFNHEYERYLSKFKPHLLFRGGSFEWASPATKSEFATDYMDWNPIVLWIIPAFILMITGIIYWALTSNKIVVTNKRVYGKALFGKRVELPFDKILTVTTSPLMKGIGISTSSGSIRFALLKNTNEVSEKITQLLIARQNENSVVNSIQADELAKYKKLFDDGVISQKEFNAKKKQLLGL